MQILNPMLFLTIWMTRSTVDMGSVFYNRPIGLVRLSKYSHMHIIRKIPKKVTKTLLFKINWNKILLLDRTAADHMAHGVGFSAILTILLLCLWIRLWNWLLSFT